MKLKVFIHLPVLIELEDTSEEILAAVDSVLLTNELSLEDGVEVDAEAVLSSVADCNVCVADVSVLLTPLVLSVGIAVDSVLVPMLEVSVTLVISLAVDRLLEVSVDSRVLVSVAATLLRDSDERLVAVVSVLSEVVENVLVLKLVDSLDVKSGVLVNASVLVKLLSVVSLRPGVM